MIKYIYFSFKGPPAIYECEVSVVTPKPDECKGDEQLYTVIAPAQFNGEKWYSQHFCDTLEQCKSKAEKMILLEVERLSRKKGEFFTQEDLQKKISEIEIKSL
jgi:hypothetical protein